MNNISQIADIIGRKVIAETLQVGSTAVSNAIARGAFPASWYLSIQALCEERELEFDPSWFSMIRPSKVKGAAA
ncbi:hypothetical protein [Pseudophaeobacter arcticus]|jgi:hypothetical protein|uniref:hypothetical protein n=1 Tax=Pseudophaeobacter sp. TaxID=1971739 RepID=UPI0004832588